MSRIRLEPLGRVLDAEPGTALADVLFPYGIEFPCGGRGRCRRCKVRVLDGAVAEDDAREFDGTLLACRCKVSGDATLDVAQWETSILADDSPFPFTPREGYGIAVDLGTTTIVAQLLDLNSARVLSVAAGLNPQVRHGADIMSRIEYALKGGADELRDLVRGGVAKLIEELAAPEPPSDIVIAGNTAMHHLYCGRDVEPLAHFPFETRDDGEVRLDRATRFLPCLGGFVGSDILAGILATRMHEHDELALLLDLGTNGEIVVGNRHGLLCCSTAAGPAFEGGRISMGMRAATGAIAEVTDFNGGFHCHVLGGGAPRGLCGSGLVDAVAVSLDQGRIHPNGRMKDGVKRIALAGEVALTQADVRELQLAKGAVAAGMHILLRRMGATADQVERVYLAGAFGNYLNRASAARIGLLPFPAGKVQPAGNTSLLGSKLVLCGELDLDRVRALVHHIPLGSDAEFEDLYIGNMAF